jgi:uncharacterized protein (TIGR03663 family)
MKWERWLFVGALMAGALLRLPQLELRPMHTDEAVHAIKFGALLETGTYQYDKHEYHGPTLNYLTLVPAWLASEQTLARLTETTLRIVPVVFGLCLILLFLLIGDFGLWPIAVAAALTACSPAMVFYSRYYIQETLLVFFALALITAGYRLITSRLLSWSILAGVAAGLMFATKETWLISCGMMVIALIGAAMLRSRDGRQKFAVSGRNIWTAMLCWLVVSVLFFSSFFTHWQGVLDSVLTYETYFTRAGENVRHGHPWYYFLQILTFTKGDHGPVWTEAGIVVFGFFGIWNAIKEKASPLEAGGELRLFLGLYALLMLCVSSAIPYKTPWLVLGALQPLILMAGFGVVAFLKWLPGRLFALGVIVVTLMVGYLGWEAYLANFTYYDDPVNPYVYSHPTGDVKVVGDAVTEIVRTAPTGAAVQVVFPGDDYWPLPWYLRTLPKVGWWNAVKEDFVPTDIMLVSPEVEPALLTRLYEKPPPGQRPLYVPLFDRPMFLRPGKEVRGYVALDLRDKSRKERTE